ncbi:MAG: Lin0512 family protein [Pseudomonadota bacterium]|nr:Lin0512 family protein [Pseudomonadota bacterium]
MSLKRMLLEIGMGNDLHGGDYTKAAVRAMQDAMHHSSLSMIRSLGIQWDDVNIFVTIGVQKPDAIDHKKIKAVIPSGQVSVTAVKGGLDVNDREADDKAVIATAALEIMVELP